MLIPNLADAEDATQAQVDSRDFSDILAPAFSYTGVLSGCAVAAQGTPNMTVAISAGVVVVNGVVVTVAAGNVTISANASGNARFDLICVDAAGVKSAVAGIPSTSPVFPNPAGKVVLAAVRVPAGAASISNAKLVDKRVFNTLSSLAFGAAGDTNLYRNGANSLQTDGSLYVKGNAAGIGYVFNPLSAAGNALATIAPGDTNYRHAIDVNGGMGWGPGNSAGDTNLYRLQSGHLKTDGFFQAGQGAILRYGDAAQVTLGSLNQFFGGAPAAAGIAFGSAGDTNLYRGQANTLQTTGSLFFKGGAGTYPIAVYANLTDGNSQFYIDGGTGRLNWGPGNSGADTWIYRGSNPGLLGVHTDLWVEGSVLPQGNMQAVSSVSRLPGKRFLADTDRLGRHYAGAGNFIQQCEGHEPLPPVCGRVANGRLVLRQGAGLFSTGWRRSRICLFPPERRWRCILLGNCRRVECALQV
jgi:hypothetical protein